VRRLGVVLIAAFVAASCRGVGAPGPVGGPGPGGAPAPAPAAAPKAAPVVAPAAPPLPPTTPAAAPNTAPPAAAEAATADIVRDHCLTCHSEDLLRQQRLTAAQWTKTIDKMRKWGSTLPENRAEGLAAFLARQYGREAGPWAAESIPAPKAAELFAPQPAAAFAGGDRARGLALYADRCQPCHEEAGRGGEGSVTIAGRRILDRPADLAELIRTGRGDMPSFDETTNAEIADLIAYLVALPPDPPSSAGP
jgi:mono/diheme cytochrome c family protein